MWYVYVLECSDGSLYTGISNNPEKRFLEHKNGKGGRYTKSHKPTEIVYLEQVRDKPTALKRELQIKRWSHKKKIEILDIAV